MKERKLRRIGLLSSIAFWGVSLRQNSEHISMLQNNKKPLKEIIELVFALIYAMYLAVIRKNTSQVVLYYHGIDKANIAAFRKQMAYLASECIVVKPSKIKTTEKNEGKCMVAITFDDAFLSVVENAVPILREYELSAGIFVPVDNLGQKPRWQIPENCPDKDEIVMTKEQIAELDKEGFEIFSHTLSHPVLTRIEDGRLQAELVESKQALEEIVGHEVLGISYPHGACDARVREVARKAGYKLGFTIEPSIVDTGTDDLRIGRFSVSPTDSFIKFMLKVSGGYQVLKYLRKPGRIIAT